MTLADTQNAMDASSPPAVVRIVDRTVDWDRLEHQWSELFAVSPTASPPMRFEWMRRWWDIYGPVYSVPDGGLRMVTVWRASRLIGVLPLYRNMRGPAILALPQLRFLSTGEAESEETCAEYLDLLHAPGEHSACLQAVQMWLRNERDWDELELNDVALHSPLLALEGYSQKRFRVAVAARGVCPIADIDGGIDAYLGRLSPTRRQQARRLLRVAKKAGAVLDMADDLPTTERFFDDLITLHQQRWSSAGQPGCFASPRFVEFHRSLARSWVPQGKAVLARYSLHGKPIAVIYGFVVGAKFDFYQSGIAIGRQEALGSPGIVALLTLMSHLADRGIAQFDFLRGESFYKERLATTQNSLVCLRVVRPTLRRSIYGASSSIRNAAVRCGRLLRARVAAPRRPMTMESM